jgi:hypothetical protein
MGVIAVTLALVFGGVGIAGAATQGNPFILGKANDETTQSDLNNSNGVPLKLVAPANKAPLKVSNSNLVSGLNSQYLSGQSASQLQTTGGDGFTSVGTNTPLGNSATQIVSTGPLPVGTYYVTATAWLNVHTGDTVGQCFIRNSVTGANFEWGGSDPGTPEPNASGSELQAAETAAMAATTPGTAFQEWCLAGGTTSGSFASDAGITAIRIASSSGTPPGSAHVPAHRPVLAGYRR